MFRKSNSKKRTNNRLTFALLIFIILLAQSTIMTSSALGNLITDPDPEVEILTANQLQEVEPINYRAIDSLNMTREKPLMVSLNIEAIGTIMEYKFHNEPSKLTTNPVMTPAQINYEQNKSIEPEEQPDEPEVQEFIGRNSIETNVFWNVPLDDDIQIFLTQVCEEYDVPVQLVLSMMAKESSYRAGIISKTNDYGLMQINKCNHKWLKSALGISDFLDPYDNIRAGVFMISGHLHKQGENMNLALMAYNMGEGGARKLWNQGIYSSSYSRSIISNIDNITVRES